MTWGLVAVAGATLVGGVVSGISGSNAASSAAGAQERGALEAAQVQREGLTQQQAQYDTSRKDALDIYARNREDALNVYNTSRSDLSPYRNIGTNALLALSDQLGIARPAGYENANTGSPQFREDPGYKFAVDEGRKSVDARFRGQSRSGAKMKALDEFGQGVADQQYGNWLARLSGLASVGQTATGQSSSLGSAFTAGNNSAAAGLTNNLANIGANNATAIGNYSANTGSLLQDSAAARASGYVGSSNAWSSALGNTSNNLASLYGMSKGGGANDNWLQTWMGST